VTLRHAVVAGAVRHRVGDPRFVCETVRAMGLAETEGACRYRRAIELGAYARGYCHLSDRRQKAAVGNVVHGAGDALGDKRADEVAVLALRRKVDRRRRALLALADFAQIERLPEPPCGLAYEQNRFVLALEGKRRGLGEVVDQADPADGGRGQDRAAVGSVEGGELPG